MLELGPGAAQAHAGLADELVRHSVDLVYCAGPLMRGLYEAAPAAMRGAWTARVRPNAPSVLEAPRAGDVVMVKGSNGSAMASIVAALRAQFSAPAPPA
jgi:UDP-N-acetylmuramoyl-tripeptide--D-alanyl-D-alanine ligase